MNNQRKESRKKLVAFTPVYDLMHKSLLGYIGDLTPQGMMVIGEKPITIGSHLMLDLELLSMRISLSARAAWCRPDESPQYFNIGFEFLDVLPENLRMIEIILNRYQFQHVMDVSDLKP
jgi:Tfp pilus assembly protein PilZ